MASEEVDMAREDGDMAEVDADMVQEDCDFPGKTVIRRRKIPVFSGCRQRIRIYP